MSGKEGVDVRVLFTSAKENCSRNKNEPFQTFPKSWELGESAACCPPASPHLLMGSGFRGVTAEGLTAGSGLGSQPSPSWCS